jgi:hypothetical protein
MAEKQWLAWENAEASRQFPSWCGPGAAQAFPIQNLWAGRRAPAWLRHSEDSDGVAVGGDGCGEE